MNNPTQADWGHYVAKDPYCGIKTGNDRSIQETGSHGGRLARMLGQLTQFYVRTGSLTIRKVGAVDMSRTYPVDNQLVSQPGKRGGGVPPALTRHSLSRLGHVGSAA